MASSYPFFQGSLQNLSDFYGGPSAAGIISDQIERQAQDQKQGLLKQQLDIEKQRQDMEFAKEKNPLELEQMRAGIENTRASARKTGLDADRLAYELRVAAEAGGEKAAAKALQLKRAMEEAETRDKQMTLFRNEVMQTPWSSNLKTHLSSIIAGFSLPQEVSAAIWEYAKTQKSWEEFQQRTFSMSPKAREETQKQDAAYNQATDVARIQSEGRAEAARIRAEQEAQRQAKITSLEGLAANFQNQAFKLREQAKQTPANAKALEAQAIELEQAAKTYLEQAQAIRLTPSSGAMPADVNIPRIPVPAIPSATPRPQSAPAQPRTGTTRSGNNYIVTPSGP